METKEQLHKFVFYRSTKNKKYFHGIKLDIPTEKECKKYNQLWDMYNAKGVGGFTHEDILNEKFNKNKSHKDVVGMYDKCVLLDKFYSTSVKHLDQLIEHFITIEKEKSEKDKSYFDLQIEKGSAEFVDTLKCVQLEDGEIINYISFSSKYCRRYNPEAFPIYDNIVKEVLEYYISMTNFYGDNLPTDWTKNYVSYKKVVDKFIEKYSFIEDYIMFDKYLWALGKFKLEGINFIKTIRKGKDKDIKRIKKKLQIKEDITIEQLENKLIEKYDIKN